MQSEIRVRCCSDCPFLYVAHTEEAEPYCTADGEAALDDDVDIDHRRQPWCPLNGVDVVIKVVDA